MAIFKKNRKKIIASKKAAQVKVSASNFAKPIVNSPIFKKSVNTSKTIFATAKKPAVRTIIFKKPVAPKVQPRVTMVKQKPAVRTTIVKKPVAVKPKPEVSTIFKDTTSYSNEYEQEPDEVVDEESTTNYQEEVEDYTDPTENEEIIENENFSDEPEVDNNTDDESEFGNVPTSNPVPKIIAFGILGYLAYQIFKK